jgi:hypothetical protein
MPLPSLVTRPLLRALGRSVTTNFWRRNPCCLPLTATAPLLPPPDRKRVRIGVGIPGLVRVLWMHLRAVPTGGERRLADAGDASRRADPHRLRRR